VIAAVAQTLEAATPQPAPLPASPTAQEDAYALTAEGRISLAADGLLETDQDGALLVAPAPDSGGGAVLVAGPSTQLSLQAVTAHKVLATLGRGGVLLIWSGSFPEGVVLSFGPTGSALTVRTGCAMLVTTVDGWDVTCWGGECSYAGAIGVASIPLKPWERLALSSDPLQTAAFAVGESELRDLQSVLARRPTDWGRRRRPASASAEAKPFLSSVIPSS
jgi:hypothetical protein